MYINKEKEDLYGGVQCRINGEQKELCNAKSPVYPVYSTGVCWLLRTAKGPIAASKMP